METAYLLTYIQEIHGDSVYDNIKTANMDRYGERIYIR